MTPKSARVEFNDKRAALSLLDFNAFGEFLQQMSIISGIMVRDLHCVRQLVVAGSSIDTFEFLGYFPALEKLTFLACRSDIWHELKGTEKIISLRLHNLKQGKRYLSNLDFLHTFPQLQYLYVNMLGIDRFPDVKDLTLLHAIFGSFRNENEIQKPVDFTALAFQPNLKIFNYWMAVDRHRIPAESMAPILQNPSVSSVSVIQMYGAEEKKLNRLMEKLNRPLMQTTLPNDELQQMIREYFAW